MTYKLNPAVSKILSPVVLEIGQEKRRYPDGTAAAADSFDRAYRIESVRAASDRPIDCGVLESPDLNIHEAMAEVLKGEGLDSFNTWKANYETIMAEADRKEEGQHKTEPTLTYYVTGNVEFPSVGEFHEVETLEEAIKLYEAIPSEPMNAAKGIGINLVDGSEFSGMYPLYQEGKGVSEMSALGEHCMESPLVQRAVEEAKQRFAEPADVHREEDTPTVKSEKEDQTSSPQKTTVQESGSRKESILNALRDRQTKIKERDKQNREQRSHEMKKGDLAL